MSTHYGARITLQNPRISGGFYTCIIQSVVRPDPNKDDGTYELQSYTAAQAGVPLPSVQGTTVTVNGLTNGQRAYIVIKEYRPNGTVINERGFNIQALPRVRTGFNAQNLRPVLTNMIYISSSDFEIIMTNPQSFKKYIVDTKLDSPDYKKQISHNMPFGGYLIYYIGRNDISGIDLAKSLKIGIFSKDINNKYVKDFGVDFTSPITPRDGSNESNNYPGGWKGTTNGMILPWYIDEQPSTAHLSPHPCFVNPPRTILAGGRSRPNCLTLVNISSYNHENIYYPLNFNDSDNKLLWDNSDPLYNGRIYIMKLGDFEGSQIQELMFKQEQRFPWPLGGMTGTNGSVTPISHDTLENVQGGSPADLDGVCIFNDRVFNNSSDSEFIEGKSVFITFTPDTAKATKPYGGYRKWKLPSDWKYYTYYSSFTENKITEIGLNGCITYFPDIGPPTLSGCGNQNPNPRMN